MDYEFTRNIFIPSLKLIRSDHKIKRFYFFPGLISVILLSAILVYQVIYTYVVLLGKQDKVLGLILQLFHSSYVTELLIAACILIIFHIIISPIFEGALIRYIDNATTEGSASRSDSIGFGIVRFYPLFEFKNTFNMFKFISIVNGYLFTLRFLGLEYISSLSIFFGITFLFSIILNVLIAYARYEIVLENKGVFEAIGVSAQIALLNIKTTLRLYVLMFIMNIKVILNFIIFLIFPILGAFIAGVVTSQTFATIAFIVLGIFFIFLILILGYMTAVLDIFTTAIWYYAYKQGKQKLEKNT